MKYSQLAAALVSLLVFESCSVQKSDIPAANTAENQNSAASAPSAQNDNDSSKKYTKERKLRLMQFALIFLNSRYVEPERIHWQNMTVHGIDALQNMVPEVVADFDRRIDDSPTKLELRVANVKKQISLANISSLTDAYEISQDVFNFIYSNMTSLKSADDMEYAMINGMFGTLDPHTNLLPPYMFEDVMTGNGGFAGCGFVVGVRDDSLTVISPMEGTPAWKAGIKAGDIIVRIDDESTENMPLQDAVDRMRGDAGSKVVLYVQRKGWAEPHPIEIIRAKIEVKSVTSQALKKDNVGYIKLKSFDQTTASEVKTHLDALHKAMPDMKGLIIDLRNNSGGLLLQSIQVSELFLAAGQTIVSVEGPTRQDRESTQARKNGPERGYPIAVLINEGSASASEIVSGALQQNGRAVVIGERSFGKGSVQILKDNPDGSAIKVTSAQYLTPGDVSIQGVGIVPDIELKASFIGDDGISLIETENIRRESSLEQSLHSDKTTHQESFIKLHYLYKDSQEEKDRAKALGLTTYDLRSTDDYTQDSESDFAIALIKQAKSADRTEILQQSASFFAEYTAEYRKNVADAFKKYKIDWNPSPEGSACKSFEWGMKYNEQAAQNGEKIVFSSTGKENNLIMWVKNTCEKEDLVQFSAALASNSNVLEEREFVFGRIKPNETREWPIKVKIPKSIPSRDDDVKVRFYEGCDSQDDIKPLDIEGHFLASTVRASQPQFAYTYWIDDVRRGTGDGSLSRNESVDMYLWIKNIGSADSDKVQISVANQSGSGILLQQGRASMDRLAVGESRLAVLKFDVSHERPEKPPSKRIKRDKPFNPDEALLRLTIADNAYDERIEQPISAMIDAVPAVQSEKTFKTQTLRNGAQLFTAAEKGVSFASVLEDIQVEAYDAGNGMSAVCWKDGDLNPCAFAQTSRLGEANPKADKKAKGKSDKKPDSSAALFSPLFLYEAPQIRFEDRSHTAKEDAVTVTAHLSDNANLRDYEAYVWTRDGIKLNAEKLDYGLISGTNKDISISMPLKPGDNTLVIVARDNLETETVGVFHVNKN